LKDKMPTLQLYKSKSNHVAINAVSWELTCRFLLLTDILYLQSRQWKIIYS
jgi:hypothetical protein